MACLAPPPPVEENPSVPLTVDQQIQNSTLPINNFFFMLSGLTLSAANDFEKRSGDSHGLQFKDPFLSSTFSYRSFDDSSAGGFGGNEVAGSVGFDADIYDGLISGAMYQHVHAGSKNVLGTSDRLDSDGISLYAAKRFFNLLNVGASYLHLETDHRLSRTVTANLDSASDGFTAFSGVSSRKDRWSWGTTMAYSFVNDDYLKQVDQTTSRVSWGGNLGYDFFKQVTLSAAFNYYRFLQQYVASGSPRDDDYWTIGPRLTFYPTKELTLHLDFESMQGYRDISSATVLMGADFAF